MAKKISTKVTVTSDDIKYMYNTAREVGYLSPSFAIRKAVMSKVPVEWETDIYVDTTQKRVIGVGIRVPGNSDIYSTYDDYDAKMPRSVKRFISRVVRGKSVEPFTFILRV